MGIVIEILPKTVAKIWLYDHQIPARFQNATYFGQCLVHVRHAQVFKKVAGKDHIKACMGSAVVGFSYGACLSLFPSATADFWGTKNMGLNYGIMFTAWGVGGVFGPIMAGKIADLTGSYELGYYISSALLIVGALMTLFTKAPEKKTLPVEKLDVAPIDTEETGILNHPAAYKVRYKKV